MLPSSRHNHHLLPFALPVQPPLAVLPTVAPHPQVENPRSAATLASSTHNRRPTSLCHLYTMCHHLGAARAATPLAREYILPVPFAAYRAKVPCARIAVPCTVAISCHVFLMPPYLRECTSNVFDYAQVCHVLVGTYAVAYVTVAVYVVAVIGIMTVPWIALGPI